MKVMSSLITGLSLAPHDDEENCIVAGPAADLGLRLDLESYRGRGAGA